MTKLNPEDLATALEKLPGWCLSSGALERTFPCRTFTGAVSFVRQVAELAEDAGHHPDIDIRYDRVRLTLVTHDAGGITTKDIALAQEINRLNPD